MAEGAEDGIGLELSDIRIEERGASRDFRLGYFKWLVLLLSGVAVLGLYLRSLFRCYIFTGLFSFLVIGIGWTWVIHWI